MLKYGYIFLFLLMALVPGMILLNSGVYSISSDETSRTLISFYWFEYGKLESSSWLPLHFIIMGSGFALIKDLVMLPRLISLFFGVLSLIAVVLLTHELFRKKNITIVSAIIVFLIPQRVILSIVPLPEIIFFTFICFASYFFIRWLNTEDSKWIVLTVLFTALSTSVRYEGWIFAAVLGIFLLSFNVKIILKAGLSAVLAAFPLFWIAYNYHYNGSFFYFLDVPSAYFAQAQEKTAFNLFVFNPLLQFIEQNLITLNIAGIAGVILLRKDKKIIKMVYIFFIPLLIFAAVSVTGKSLPAHNFWRTSAVWVLLLIPFTSYIMIWLKNKLQNKTVYLIILGMVILQLINSNLYYIKNVKWEYCLTEEKISSAKNIINYIHKNSFEDERVLIENTNTFEHFDITLASQDPFRFIYSERNSIVPYDRIMYKDANINYYLIRSVNLKNKMNSKFRKILEVNGWTLYKSPALKANNEKYLRPR